MHQSNFDKAFLAHRDGFFSRCIRGLFGFYGSNIFYVKENLYSLFVRTGDRDTRIATFGLDQLPGCCGVVVSHSSMVEAKYREKGVGKELNQLRLDIATTMGYGYMLATTIEGNDAQTKIMLDNGWETLKVFINPKTKNKVFLWGNALVDKST